MNIIQSKPSKFLYTERELKQRSPEWLEIRKTCIGGSDTGVILGHLKKYEKAETWFKRRIGKLGPRKEVRVVTRGAILEKEAKKVVTEYLRTEENIINPRLHPYFAKHPKYSFLGVSFDGVDRKNKFITELKCPGYSWNFKSVFENGIQDYYYPQIQLQLSVARELWGIEKAYFASYFPDGAYILDQINFIERYKTLAVLDVEYDAEYCEKMIKVLSLVWSFIENEAWDKEAYKEAIKEYESRY